ncbi:MAG TPA: SRPBCC domain-containing protein [Steroidobacteraceae bacterium]|nr:SRPBCC domain-containing protein [Steroidobacteraceae bacterium]
MQRRGTLVEDGEYAILTFRRMYRHSLVHVWEAIATPEGLRAWLMCNHAVIDGRVGGRVELVSGPTGYRSTGKILVWEPPRVLEYEWNVAPLPEMPGGERAIFRYELTPEGDSTHVLVTYRRITMQTARGFLPGLHAFLDRLEAQLDGRALPDWMQRFGELQLKYPEWSGHAPDPGK